MSLLIPAVVVYGFSFTVGNRLIHPAIPRPPILYLHAVVFSGWLLFFLLQSALVRSHNVRLHRRIGWFGAALGVLIFVVGVSTAVAMARFNTLQMHATDAESFLRFRSLIWSASPAPSRWRFTGGKNRSSIAA
jgi:hypothetical protein